MVSIEQSDQPDLAKALKANRLVALVMAVSTAAVLLLLRPELCLVYLSYAAISVFSLSLIRTYGVFVKPYPAREQNFAAYVSISTIGFLATVIGAPHMIELHATGMYVLLSIVMAGLLLRAIVKSL
ncbi:MAG: hypothetical protein KUA43_08080 [Hoeflea sp.]|uniref:hypothetical protein n=1 Tax=Hoeflea sp. TaxID=1940281 RepID=UPI001D665800|nr:hypothetical protein [Hoeflea sp.]MBU4528918.1 hypothetical protein [Alphaproteobacteria bacterium]MBU4544051.1 hypothetical protein [Alphaproteobacteria bacterium]MBU4551920.1 hypothetical protein [Alphaproteobacteria bacterium]MBV1723385.1 hypothetical protein [Hoeflea sp.]MBV1760364.1 hypothetical protein [Hoeflea sp.]